MDFKGLEDLATQLEILANQGIQKTNEMMLNVSEEDKKQVENLKNIQCDLLDALKNKDITKLNKVITDANNSN